ncbi:MAG TPA: RNA polymerase sigma factor [Saprospiraceae bacterium]|nr:RNA polymerase sigma factor [Saprospiraceae bacterium]
MTEKELIQACRKRKRKAQQKLFDTYSPKMNGVLMRYLRSREDREDVLIEAFFKVFDNLDKFRGDGSFEGWIRRIVVNEALMFLRKQHNFNMTLEITDFDQPVRMKVVDHLAAQDILSLMEELPTGYRTVFNLYVIEGYKHREIAELLDISINTSKSQLILARKRMRELLKKNSIANPPNQKSV